MFADDDGFNVAGGNDQSSLNRMGANPFDVNVLQNLEATYEAGTEITISDATGNVMLSWIADKTFNSLVFSSSELTIGETYTISIAGDLTKLTLTDTVNSNGGFGGMMQPGGENMMQPGNNMPTPPDMNSNEMPMMPEEPIEANDYL